MARRVTCAPRRRQALVWIPQDLTWWPASSQRDRWQLGWHGHRVWRLGLGHARTVDRAEVWWPSGRHDCYSGLAADTGYKVREGSPVAGRLAGFLAAPR